MHFDKLGKALPGPSVEIENTSGNFTGVDCEGLYLSRQKGKENCCLAFTSSMKRKGDVTRDDSQRRFLVQHRVATLFQMVATLFQHCKAVLS